MKRLDLHLVEKGFASSRTKAQELIAQGVVELRVQGFWKKAEKASLEIEASVEIRINENDVEKYVSRGGLKLESAFRVLNLSAKGLKVLDVGQSTGGFSDFLIKHEAENVVGFDVGHGQLHSSLKSSSRILALEGLHVKDLGQSCEFLEALPSGGFDLIVGDVSFISLKQVIPFVKEFLKPQGFILALVKPQFEVGPSYLGKDGVVKDQKVIQSLKMVFQNFVVDQGFEFQNYFPSEIVGKDGNQEFFLYAKKN